MAHRHIDGMLTVAQLKRGLIKGAVYKDVTVRTDQGDIRRVGTMMITTDMQYAMTPGSRGRFYFYDVWGTKGLYGFRPVGGEAHARFPTRWEIMGYGIGGLNLLLVAALYLLDGKLPLLSLIFGALGIVMGAVFTATRTAGMRAWNQDGRSGHTRADLHAAQA